MKITLCSSAKFFEKLNSIKKSLEEKGHEVFLPSMVDYHHLTEDALAKIHYDLINDHFKKIEQSDAIYVANFDKNDIPGYIGGSSLLEMGLAFYKKIPIYLLQGIPTELSYREELLALQPKIIGYNWDLISKNQPNKLLKKTVSVVIYNSDHTRFLIVKRPTDDETLPNVWSLPATTLKEGESPDMAVARIGKDKLGVGLIIVKPIGEGQIETDKATIHMKEYEAQIIKEKPKVPQMVLGITQYQKWDWGVPEQLKEAAKKGSLSSRLLLTNQKMVW